MGGHVWRPIVSDPSILLTATPEGQSMPPTLTPMRDNAPGLCGTGTPTLPRLTPQASAILAVPPRQDPDREEEMDSEPQQAGARVPAVEAAMGSRSKFLLLLLAHP